MTLPADAAGDSPTELEAVRHLVELGYADPLELAARRAMAEQAQQSQFHRAEELLRAGHTAAAIEILEPAVQTAHDWIAGRRLLARAYFRAGQFDAASELLEWLELHAVEHAELALMRATITLKQRRLDEALDHAQYALHLSDALPAAELIVAEVHLRRGRLDAAEAAYRAIDGPQHATAAKIGLAAVALRRCEYEVAAELALEALEQDLCRWEAHWCLGRALMHLGRWPEARVAMETCARLRPSLAAPHRWLAKICEQQDDDANAAEFRQRAREATRRRRSPRK